MRCAHRSRPQAELDADATRKTLKQRPVEEPKSQYPSKLEYTPAPQPLVHNASKTAAHPPRLPPTVPTKLEYTPAPPPVPPPPSKLNSVQRRVTEPTPPPAEGADGAGAGGAAAGDPLGLPPPPARVRLQRLSEPTLQVTDSPHAPESSRADGAAARVTDGEADGEGDGQTMPRSCPARLPSVLAEVGRRDRASPKSFTGLLLPASRQSACPATSPGLTRAAPSIHPRRSSLRRARQPPSAAARA